MAVAATQTLERPAFRSGRLTAARLVRPWLIALAVLVVMMVAVGGATRLTGSGLSITEWKPVTGAVPPLSEAAWTVEFEKYRGSSQYRNLNRGMALPEFKTIYWWEWGHRQLGRFLGLFFFLPLLWFWWSGAVSRRRALGYGAIGALGGLQATVGWIMVASGLEAGMVAVAPLKLMAHLVLASVILALLVWAADGVRREPGRGLPSPLRGGSSRAQRDRGGGRRTEDPTVGPGGGTPTPSPSPQGGGDRVESVAKGALILLGLILLQIALGGLVAGSKAGWTYNTWPLMDGRLLPPPDALGAMGSAFDNLVANPALVQLNHRLLAYAVVLATLLHAWQTHRTLPGSARSRIAAGIAALALAQMALGIVTLLLAVPLWAGLAHQLLAMALLVMATLHARRCLDRSRRPLPAAA